MEKDKLSRMNKLSIEIPSMTKEMQSLPPGAEMISPTYNNDVSDLDSNYKSPNLFLMS